VRRSRRTPSRQAERTLVGISDRLDELREKAHVTSTGLADTSPRFQLVVVCTGNRFRSPLAAAVVQQLVADLPVEVSSLGTLDLGDAPPLRAAVKQAGRLGLDLSSHRARTLVGTDLRYADLIIGFERAHVGAAVLEARAPRERAFLLTELVELLDASPPLAHDDPLRRARAAVARADATRREDPAEWQREIPDPLGGSARVARDVATDVQRLTVALVRGLFGFETVAPLPRRRPARRWLG
jgi:protein-tyrosine phosphatase